MKSANHTQELERESRSSSARIIAIILLVPSLAILTMSLAIGSWLLETRARLDNDYWESQILFAFVALMGGNLGLPFLVLRSIKPKVGRLRFGWLFPLISYLLLMVYMEQSHFPLLPKVIFLTVGVVFLGGAFMGFDRDR